MNDLIELLYKDSNHGIFINENIDEILSLLFADDVANASDTVVNLQRQIHTAEKFCDSTGMKINMEKKCCFQKVGCIKKIINEKWYLNEKNIEVVPNY